MCYISRQYIDLLQDEKETLTNRKTDADQITQIQAFREAIQMCVHDSVNKISKLHYQ